MPPVPLNKFVPCEPFARGEDVVEDLTGPVDAAGWSLDVRCSYTPVGPTIISTGVTATYIGGSGNVIRLTLPASFTTSLALGTQDGQADLYVEVWRTDAGNNRPLRRLKYTYYDSVRL